MRAQETFGQEGDLETVVRGCQDFEAFGDRMGECWKGSPSWREKNRIRNLERVIPNAIVLGGTFARPLLGPRGATQIAGVHLDPSWSERDTRSKLHGLSRSLLPQAQALGIIVGDFNFYEYGES
eukprot:762447-Pyramimonas_sp.AAC.1